MEIFDIVFLVLFFVVLSIVYGLMMTFAKGLFRIAFLSLFTLVGITGVVFGFIGELLYTPIGNVDAVAFRFSFLPSLLISLVITLLIFFGLRKKAEKRNLYIIVFSAFFGILAALTAAGMGYVTFTNGYLDDSGARGYNVPVTGKNTYTSDKTTEYYVYFKHWGPNHQRNWMRQSFPCFLRMFSF